MRFYAAANRLLKYSIIGGTASYLYFVSGLPLLGKYDKERSEMLNVYSRDVQKWCNYNYAVYTRTTPEINTPVYVSPNHTIKFIPAYSLPTHIKYSLIDYSKIYLVVNPKDTVNMTEDEKDKFYQRLVSHLPNNYREIQYECNKKFVSSCWLSSSSIIALLSPRNRCFNVHFNVTIAGFMLINAIEKAYLMTQLY